MGIQINGNTNNINAGIGSLSIEDINELDIVGVATAANFKTGSSNLHTTGLTVGNNFFHSTGINVGTGATIHVPSSNILTLGTNSNERLRIESGGDLRLNNADSIIHTSADTSRLRIFGGSTNSTTNGAALALHGVNHSAGNYAVLASGNGGFIRFSTGATPRLQITSGGDINVHNTTAASTTDPVTLDLGGQYTTNASITQANLKLKLYHNGSNGDAQGITASASGLSYVSGHTTGHIFYTVPSSINSLVERVRIQSTGVVNIGDTTATSQNDRLLQIGKTDRSATYLELRTSTTGAGGIVLSDGTGSGNEGYRGTLEYVHSSDYMLFKTAATERLRINNEGAISVQSVLTGNAALVYLKNGRTRASGNKYGIEFRDNINEANANIVIQQNSSGNNAAHMSFYMNGGTGGNGLENGNHTLRLKQSGDIEIPTGGIEFRSLSTSTPQAAPASINLGGTHSNAAGNGTNLNAKLKVWSDGTDLMGLSVSSNQLDYIITQEVYDHVWYGGNSGTSELMRLEGDGDLILTNGNKLNINKSNTAGQYGALLNIGWDQGTNTETRAIDIGGGWSTGENKRITFSHSTGANNLVGEINSIHYGGTPSRTSPHSGLRFGKLYHSGDSTTFTMSLDSTSATTADLNLKGAYRSPNHPAFCVSGSSMSNFSTLTKMQYTTHGTHGVNQDGFDNSNDRFVAPVDGVYHFYVRHWYQSGSANSTVWLYFYRNGSQIKEVRKSYGSSAPGEYVTVQLSTTVFLSATNYIEVYGASTNNALHPSSGSFHTEFSGFMVC